MDDLIERLNTWRDQSAFAYMPTLTDDLREAAAELARLRGENEQLRNAILWALGYDVGGPEFEPPEGDHPRYWWRKELRRRAGDVDAAKGPSDG